MLNVLLRTIDANNKTTFMSEQSIPKGFTLHHLKREGQINNRHEVVKLNTSKIMDHVDRDLNFRSPPLSRWKNNQERFQVLLLICSLCKYLNRQCAGQPNKSVKPVIIIYTLFTGVM